MLMLGTKTRWGEVAAVGVISGERYYWLIDKYGTVSMLHSFIVEEHND